MIFKVTDHREGVFVRMKSWRLKKSAAAVLSVILAVCLCSGFISGTAQAQGRRNVKVAFFPMSGYNERQEDGSYTGMDVEYLHELSRYADWDIEYVECEDWDEAFEFLKNKKVDLVGSAQY